MLPYGPTPLNTAPVFKSRIPDAEYGPVNTDAVLGSIRRLRSSPRYRTPLTGTYRMDAWTDAAPPASMGLPRGYEDTRIREYTSI